MIDKVYTARLFEYSNEKFIELTEDKLAKKV